MFRNSAKFLLYHLSTKYSFEKVHDVHVSYVCKYLKLAECHG